MKHNLGNTKQLLVCHLCILLIIAGEDIGQFMNSDYFFPYPFTRTSTVLSTSHKTFYTPFRQFVWTCCMAQIRRLANDNYVPADEVVRQANQLISKVLVPQKPILSNDQIYQLSVGGPLALFASQPGLTISNTQHEQYLTYHLLPPGLRFAVLKALAVTHPHDLGFGLTMVRYLQDAKLPRDALLWLGTLLQKFPHLPLIRRM
ncbi:hypothetical protein H4R35_001885 [Dimargaris xerosporica]|nr:hypothetical protein H4R35_001885 [Dimargaris xerosporica]